MTKLSTIGEIGLLAELERRGLIVGVANDAAELAGGLIVTQDALVENVHFRLDWISWRDLGWRAVAASLSDLAASGAAPEALFVSLSVPGSTDDSDIVELFEGMAETGVPIAGGDTTSSDSVYLSVTALGRSERVPGRAGAKPGDLLVVTGPLGRAGAAFRERSYARFPLRLREGRELAAHAGALMDISDGIAIDLGHIARRSGVRCVVELDRVPLAPGAGIEDLAFGEDFELLAALDPAAGGGYAVIGLVEEGEGVELLLDGEPHALTGWEHFS